MEITGKVLREVEFRDRLRGYDTDEVDEFLEEVAVAVDDLHRRLAQQAGRAVSAPEVKERPVEQLPSFDDDSIRRTLVLAQRTADLAIKEANEEATRILEESRREAQELVAMATENARRIRQDADEEFTARVNTQLAQREQLERDVRTLGSLVTEERDRIADSLQTVLRYVNENLSVAHEVTTLASSPPPTSSTPVEPPVAAGAYFAEPKPDPEPEPEPSATTEALPDIDAEEEEEETVAFTGPTTTPTPVVAPTTMPAPATGASVPDPDEELWQRWAQSEDLEDEGNADDADPFGFNRRP